MQYVIEDMREVPMEWENMIENGLILTGSDAELLSRALTEVKSKALAESEVSLDNSQALERLVSRLTSAEKGGQENEEGHANASPLRKRIILGTIIGRLESANGEMSGPRKS
jgi:hypothetical protein